MKKLLLSFTLMLILFLVMGCSTKIKNTSTSISKTEVKEYINKIYPSCNSIDILETTPPDSIYSPYRQLISLQLLYTSVSRDMASYSLRASKAESKKEALSLIDSALYKYNNADIEFDSIFQQCVFVSDFPDTTYLNKNRIFIHVKYKVDNTIEEQNFYFNNDGKSIGHSDIDIKRAAKDALNAHRDMISQKQDVMYDKKLIRNGGYRFNKP